VLNAVGKSRLDLPFYSEYSAEKDIGLVVTRSPTVHSNLRIAEGRPSLHEVIPNIIQAVEEGGVLPLAVGPEAEVKVQLMSAKTKKSWCMLYCGGAKPVINDLRKVSHQTGIALKEESFKW
jgi:hypothetical protein